MIVGESLIGPEELSRIFPSYHPVADVKCEVESAESRVVSGVKILDTRSRRYRADACKSGTVSEDRRSERYPPSPRAGV